MYVECSVKMESVLHRAYIRWKRKVLVNNNKKKSENQKYNYAIVSPFLIYSFLCDNQE